MQIQTTPYPIEILTADYQIAGTFSTRGNPAMYINDVGVQTFAVEQATFTPLMPAAHIGEMTMPTVYVPKANAHILLIGDYTAADAQVLPKEIPLICFTDTYAIRGTFHVGAETQPADVFTDMASAILPVTGAEIYSLRPLMHDISGASDLLFVNRAAVRAFHPPGE